MAVARRKQQSHRRLSDAERRHVIDVLDSEEFIDQPPREVYAALLSRGIYLCSIRTMYRLLRERGPVRDRRAHRPAVKHPIPRLEATAPNQVWSWDISKLATYKRGSFLNLYVVLDMFSRYVVAWMVAEHENSALAKQLFAEAITKYEIEPGRLIVHQDRGAPMTAHGFTALLGELGVDRSYSRPRVSDDNPFSESHFHTVKYQPDYPGCFRDLSHARRWLAEFFDWYNNHHHHEGLNLYRPADVFFGRVSTVAACRQSAMSEAYRLHPERFPNGAPIALRPPSRVVLNPIDGARPVAVEQVLCARDSTLASLLTPASNPSTAPTIYLPGVAMPNLGAEAAVCS